MCPVHPVLGIASKHLPLTMLSLWMSVFQAAALAQKTLLIVNSDTSVPKYQLAERAFAESVTTRVTTVNLGENGADNANLARTIRQLNPSLIYCIGSKAYLMTQRIAGEKPIVVSCAINWQRFPLGPKTHGIASELPAEIQLTMFRYFFPETRKIGVLYSKKFNKQWVAQAEAAARGMNVEIRKFSVKKPRHLKRALAKLLSQVDALWLIPDPIVLSSPEAVELILKQCDEHRKPVLAFNSVFAERGAVLAISPHVPTIGRQAAGLAQEMLANEKEDKAFMAPAGSEITINLKMVKKYGMPLREDALDSVNRIIK